MRGNSHGHRGLSEHRTSCVPPFKHSKHLQTYKVTRHQTSEEHKSGGLLLVPRAPATALNARGPVHGLPRGAEDHGRVVGLVQVALIAELAPACITSQTTLKKHVPARPNTMLLSTTYILSI